MKAGMRLVSRSLPSKRPHDLLVAKGAEFLLTLMRTINFWVYGYLSVLYVYTFCKIKIPLNSCTLL